MTADTVEVLVILALGVASYAMRVGGYLVLARFERLDPRVEAALEAVPAAVMTAIVAPVVLTSGPAEAIATVVTVLAALRLSITPVLVIAAAVVVALRALGP